MKKFEKFLNVKKKSRIILALDIDPRIPIKTILSKTKGLIAGVKIGIPYIILHGKERIKEIIEQFREDYLFIADLKLADIGFVSEILIDMMYKIGFDAIISHGFIGMKGALEDIKNRCDQLGMELFVIVAMSHPGAEELLNKNVDKIIRMAKHLGIRGFIAPATMPKYITLLRKEFGKNATILSPGIGAQGAPVGSAIKNGADFEIIGRRIILSSNPLEEIKSIKSKHVELGLL